MEAIIFKRLDVDARPKHEINGLNRDPLDYVSCDPAVAPIIEAGGSGVGVAGDALHVFEGDALLEQIRNGGHTEGVGRELVGEPGVFQAALHHAANIVDVDRGAGEPLLFAHGAMKHGASLGASRRPAASR